jgi:hypothetical protein
MPDMRAGAAVHRLPCGPFARGVKHRQSLAVMVDQLPSDACVVGRGCDLRACARLSPSQGGPASGLALSNLSQKQGLEQSCGPSLPSPWPQGPARRRAHARQCSGELLQCSCRAHAPMWVPVERGCGAVSATPSPWERALAHPLQASSDTVGRAQALAPEPHAPQGPGQVVRQQREQRQQQQQQHVEPDPLRTFRVLFAPSYCKLTCERCAFCLTLQSTLALWRCKTRRRLARMRSSSTY